MKLFLSGHDYRYAVEQTVATLFPGEKPEYPEEEAAAEEEVKVPVHKTCPNCGWKVFDIETMFCDECGRRLEEDPVQE